MFLSKRDQKFSRIWQQLLSQSLSHFYAYVNNSIQSEYTFYEFYFLFFLINLLKFNIKPPSEKRSIFVRNIETKINGWEDSLSLDLSQLSLYFFFAPSFWSFSLCLSSHFCGRANQISLSRLILYIKFLFCLKEHVKMQGMTLSFF